MAKIYRLRLCDTCDFGGYKTKQEALDALEKPMFRDDKPNIRIIEVDDGEDNG